MPPLPPATQALLLANVAIYFLDQLLHGSLTRWGVLWPIGSGEFWPWQIGTYAFLHASFNHLLFNMLGLWMFGSDLELDLGRRRFLILYATSVLSAAALHIVVSPLLGAAVPILGASGGVLGLLVAYAMRNPFRTIMLLIPPIPMKARTMAIVYGLVEVWALMPAFVPGVAVLDYLMGNVAHLAHLGGMLGGFLSIRYWRRQPPFRRR